MGTLWAYPLSCFSLHMLNIRSVPHCIPSRAWDRTPKLFRRPHCCSPESMTAEETTASTSLLKDCFPGSSIAEVHVLVVAMQAHLNVGFHLGTQMPLKTRCSSSLPTACAASRMTAAAS